jgi:hypothetical protein
LKRSGNVRLGKAGKAKYGRVWQGEVWQGYARPSKVRQVKKMEGLMINIDLSTTKGAIFSDDGMYRYALWRTWSAYKPPLMFIGLNPSTANQLNNDPMITRLITRANIDGYGGLLAGNIYGLVSSNPDKLITTPDPIGTETDVYLCQMIGMAKTILCAWGSFSAASVSRINDVLAMISDPYCLGLNRDGRPKHPLYIPYKEHLIKYIPRGK